MKKKTIKVTKSSGNIFADLGFKDAEERQLKSTLAIALQKIINKRKLKQVQVAAILGVSQPKVSDILRGRLKGYSVARLFGFLLRLDQDVEIHVHDKPRNVKRPAHFEVINDTECAL